MKIAIHGGHCPGIDNGAVGDRAAEADINRAVMILLAEYLSGFGDEILRVQAADAGSIIKAVWDFGSDIFLSIHCNASVNHMVSGTEVHYAEQTGAALAACIQKRVVGALKTVDRGIKRSVNLPVLKYASCPAILVELAFISNREDETLLISRQVEFARAIAAGLMDYRANFCKNDLKIV